MDTSKTYPGVRNEHLTLKMYLNLKTRKILSSMPMSNQ